MKRLPDLLSLARIALVPMLLLTAWSANTSAFLWLFGFGLASDIADGWLARRLHVESEWGARLDQWGDFALWLTLPLAAWWLWHDIVARESAYIAVALTGMVLPTILAYLKYGEVPGYHTWSVKFGSVFMSVAAALLLLVDIPEPFRIAAGFQVLCAVDELGITLLLPTCQHDVPSLWHALRLRRTH